MVYQKVVNFRKGPEAEIQRAFIKLVKERDWFAKETHGNAYQSGFPDIYLTHRRFGARWVECKCPVGYKFTSAQIDTFPLISANGSGIWIITAATEFEYLKLFGPENWYMYLK